MANIELSFESEDYIIDEVLFRELKELAFDLLKKTSNGLDSVIEDMDFETFRRMLSTGLTSDASGLGESDWLVTASFSVQGGVQGAVFQAFQEKLGGGPPNKCIVPLTNLILNFGAVDIGGIDTTPVALGLWDNNKVKDYILKISKALQRSLSGQEQGY